MGGLVRFHRSNDRLWPSADILLPGVDLKDESDVSMVYILNAFGLTYLLVSP